MRAIAILLIAACGSSPPPHIESPPPPEPVVPVVSVEQTANLEISSTEVTFGDHVPGTLVRPTTPGRYAGLVILAGSGPTDRDWNSPLIATKNGSAKLLAETLAKHGAVVLRFDKAGVGANKTKLDGKTLDVYRDEARAALAFLRACADVEPEHLFVLGHSEGGIHAIRVAQVEGKQIAGLVLLSSAGRSMKDIILGQLEAQLRRAMPQQADAELSSLRQAFDDFLAGKPVDPTKVTQIPPLQQLVAAVVAPQTATLARGLFGLDPAPLVAEIEVPVLIYNGLKDVQVDASIDAARLEAARKAAKRDVTLFLAPDADHVLKHEPKSVEELRGNLVATQMNYNADGRTLDETTVAAIVNWLARHTHRAAVFQAAPPQI